MVTWLTWETHTTYDSIYYCTHESSTRSRFKQRPSTTFVLHETQRGEKSALILANKTITANKRDILRWCQASSVDHKNGSPIGNGWSVCLCRHLLWFATIDKALTGLMFDAWSTSDASPSLIRSCPVRFSFDRPLFIWISLVLPISLISDSLLDSVLSTGKLWETQRHFADHLHKPQRYHPLKFLCLEIWYPFHCAFGSSEIWEEVDEVFLQSFRQIELSRHVTCCDFNLYQQPTRLAQLLTCIIA